MPIFEISPEDISRLSDSDLRTLIGKLAEQELFVMGLPTSAVTYGGHQNAADGGLDVRVSLGAPSIQGYIPRPNTGFQVKAEDMPPAAIKKEMRPKEKLRDVIIELGEKDGAYVIASSKSNVSDIALNGRKNAMAQAIGDAPTAANLYLEFYDQRRIASWVNHHPGLIPWVRDAIQAPLRGWKAYADWSSAPGDLTEEYILDDGVRLLSSDFNESDGLPSEAALDRIRKILSNPKGVVRLIGLSGVGKTRFAQALFDARVGSNSLSPASSVYADIADDPDPGPIDLLRYLTSLKRHCVLILDNCGSDLHQRLTREIRVSNAPVSLLTVEYDISDDQQEGTEVFRLEPASESVIEKILGRRHPELSAPEIQIISEFSEGNSSVALALANTAQNGESLANLRDSELVKRLFRQNKQDNPDLLQAAKICSLVYSFDGVTLEGDNTELPILASLAGQSISAFHSHIAELHRRQLVQKRSKWRALLPHALAHRLAKEALEEIPLATIRDQLVGKAPERLLRSFSRRLGYLHDSAPAKTLVAEWLQPGGYLGAPEKFNKLGLTLFENIASVDPESILNCLEVAVARASFADVGNSTRDRFAKILRSLAFAPEYFYRSTMVMGRMSVPLKTSRNLGDAVNVFVSLFYIYLSGTQASVDTRISVLRTLAASEQSSDAELVFRGIEALLKTDHFSSSYGFDFGARKRDYGYSPRSSNDIRAWYVAGLNFCLELEEKPVWKDRIRTLLAQKLGSLIGYVGLTDEVLFAVRKIAAGAGWPEAWIGARKALRLARKEKNQEAIAKITSLVAELKPRTLEDRIRSYVLPAHWASLDLVDIDIENDKAFERVRLAVESYCHEIGKDLAANIDENVNNIALLLASKSDRVFHVGVALGQETCSPLKVWDLIIGMMFRQSEQQRNATLLGSFLRGVSVRDKKVADSLLEKSLADDRLQSFFVWMQATVGLDGDGFERILRAAAVSSIPVGAFRALSGGRLCDFIEGEKFERLVSLISDRAEGCSVAIDLLSMRVFSRKSDNQELGSSEKNSARLLINKFEFPQQYHQDLYRLTTLVESCLDSLSDRSLATKLCEKLLQATKEGRLYPNDCRKLVCALARQFPIQVLDILVEKSTGVRRWSGNLFPLDRETNKSPLDEIGEEVIFSWAHERPNERFLRLADALGLWGKVGGSGDEDGVSVVWNPVARRLIAEAPDKVSVMNVIYSRFFPTSWGGSLSAILEARSSLLKELLNDHDSIVSDLARDLLAKLQQRIISEKEQEEKERRERDERFEW